MGSDWLGPTTVVSVPAPSCVVHDPWYVTVSHHPGFANHDWSSHANTFLPDVPLALYNAAESAGPVILAELLDWDNFIE